MLEGVRESMRSAPLRSIASQVITLGLIVSTALILWHVPVLLSGCEAPVTVVLTGSMEPGIKRGDVLFLNTKASPIQPGEIVVFKIEGQEIPIVHRVIEVHRRQNSNEVKFLTKGDNNNVDDRYGIYANGQLWLENHHVKGRVMGHLPYVGWAKILMTEHPLIKYLIVGGLSLLTITSN